MAWYKDETYVKKTTGDNEWWKTDYGPGDHAPVSGIYRCPGCGKEIAHNEDVSLPSQNHHQHSRAQGKVRWKLIVRSNTKGD